MELGFLFHSLTAVLHLDGFLLVGQPYTCQSLVAVRDAWLAGADCMTEARAGCQWYKL